MEKGSRKNDALYTTYLDHRVGILIKAENSSRARGTNGEWVKELLGPYWLLLRLC